MLLTVLLKDVRGRFSKDLSEKLDHGSRSGAHAFLDLPIGSRALRRGRGRVHIAAMLIFWKERLVLLAMPKTGTSSLVNALRARADVVFESPPELKHVPLFRFNRFLKPLFGVIDADRKLETMALVREPVSWLGSWYRYRSRSQLDGHKNSTAQMDFDAFVEGYLSDPRPPFANVGSPRRFVSNGQGKVAVTHLYQYEQLEKAAAFLESRLGTHLHMATANVSPARDTELSEELRARLQDAKAEEFDLWEKARR